MEAEKVYECKTVNWSNKILKIKLALMKEKLR